MAAVEVEGLTVPVRRRGRRRRRVVHRPRPGRSPRCSGPNGAGKTSTVEVLEGYRRPAAGRTSVIGLDPQRDHRALTRRVGVMLQSGGVGPGVRAGEALRHAAALYDDAGSIPPSCSSGSGSPGSERRTWRQLSGGEQRRLALALALVGRPQVAFLDEPGSGVDPVGRRAIREVVAGLRDDGVTVVLTTHDLDEAERLADHVVILDHGRVAGRGHARRAARRRRAQRRGALRRARRADGHRAGHPPRRAGQRGGAGRVPRGGRGHARAGRRAHRVAGRPRPAARPTCAPAASASRTSSSASWRRRPTRPATEAAGDAGGRREGLLAHLRLELALLVRNGESLLLTLGIPVLLLVFFANVDVLPIDGEPIQFLAPGVLALAVLSTALVQLAIGTGFEREYGVLKRLGATPLGRPRLLAAKTLAILVVELVQVAVLWLVALACGWDPSVVRRLASSGRSCSAPSAAPASACAWPAPSRRSSPWPRPTASTSCCCCSPAWSSRSTSSPAPPAAVARALPSGALAEAVRGSLTAGVDVPGRAWLVLAAWAVAAPLAATRLFRWEYSRILRAVASTFSWEDGLTRSRAEAER